MATNIEIEELKSFLRGRMGEADPASKDNRLFEYALHLVEMAENESRKVRLDLRSGFARIPKHFISEQFSAHVERMSGTRSRLVIEFDKDMAEEFRDKFGLSIIPAPLDATEAVVRATHALAGAAIEMTYVTKKLAEKL